MTPLEFLHKLQIFNKGLWISEPIPKAFYHKLCSSRIQSREYRIVERCLDWIEYELCDDYPPETLIRNLSGSLGMHTSIDNLIPERSMELFEWLSADYNNQFYVNDALEENEWGTDIAKAIGAGMYTMARDTYWRTLEIVEEMFNEYYEEESLDEGELDEPI